MKWFDNKQVENEFIEKNMMGPSSLRIVQELTSHIELTEANRILDLGCGAGLTTIYMAKQYDAMIYAADLWIDPTDNYERFQLTNVADQIIPLRAEAHELPFAKHYFDAVVSVDAYHYFGSTPEYLDTHLAPLVRSGGIIAIAIPGLQNEFDNGVPEVLQPFWSDDMQFHSAEWWRNHWSTSNLVEVIDSFPLQCHEQAWQDWLQTENPYAVGDREFLAAENGQYFATVAIIAKVK